MSLNRGVPPVVSPAKTHTLSARLELVDDWVIVRPLGDLDATTVEGLESQLELAESLRQPPRVAVELSELAFCDSSGINLFVRVWKRLRARGGTLVLVHPARQLRQALAWTGLEDMLLGGARPACLAT